GIAKKYRTTVRAISQANGIPETDLTADSRLVIPVSLAASDAVHIRYSRYPSRYRVHGGDTGLTVAEDFRVPPQPFRRWNRLKGNDVRKGRLLTVYKPLAPGEPDKAPVRKRTKKTAHAYAKPKTSTATASSSKKTTVANTP